MQLYLKTVETINSRCEKGARRQKATQNNTEADFEEQQKIESEVCYGKAQELGETKSLDRDQKLCRQDSQREWAQFMT